MPIRRAYVYSTQTHKWQTYVTSQEELSVVRKTDLNNLHNLLSEREILKLRKNNLLENIAIQDKILEEKLREGKIHQQRGKNKPPTQKANLILFGLWCDKRYGKC